MRSSTDGTGWARLHDGGTQDHMALGLDDPLIVGRVSSQEADHDLSETLLTAGPPDDA